MRWAMSSACQTAGARISRGTSAPEFSDDGETYELQWDFDVRFLADEPYHSLTPLQPSQQRPYAWEEAPESLNELLKRLTS
jgi:hypothetical protein